MSENDFDIKIIEEQNIPEKERFTGHYLDHPEIRKLLEKNWPDLLSKIENITRPEISNNPDDLESWEVGERQKRINQLIERSPLYALQSLLYEECFGVNANPGEDKTKDGSYAPTPGGMVSHGYYGGSFNGATFDSLMDLPFTGRTAKEAAVSLTDWNQKNQFVESIALVMQPFRFGESGMAEHYRHKIRQTIMVEKLTPEEAVDTWAYRLVQMIKSDEDFRVQIEDQALKNIISPSMTRSISLAEYWHMLWGHMDRLYLKKVGDELVYKEADGEVKEAIGKLLFARTHPQTQILFKYLSPSGYLNETKSLYSK